MEIVLGFLRKLKISLSLYMCNSIPGGHNVHRESPHPRCSHASDSTFRIPHKVRPTVWLEQLKGGGIIKCYNSIVWFGLEREEN